MIDDASSVGAAAVALADIEVGEVGAAIVVGDRAARAVKGPDGAARVHVVAIQVEGATINRHRAAGGTGGAGTRKLQGAGRDRGAARVVIPAVGELDYVARPVDHHTACRRAGILDGAVDLEILRPLKLDGVAVGVEMRVVENQLAAGRRNNRIVHVESDIYVEVHAFRAVVKDAAVEIHPAIPRVIQVHVGVERVIKDDRLETIVGACAAIIIVGIDVRLLIAELDIGGRAGSRGVAAVPVVGRGPIRIAALAIPIVSRVGVQWICTPETKEESDEGE